jgi:FHS family L-fucose permease-like MFS transporter
MAFASSGNHELKGDKQTSYLLPFILVTSLFFLWGLANSLNGTLIKHFQTALNLNRAQAGIVDSAFYIGYFVMAIPAGFILNKVGYKKGILIGLALYVMGALLFYPAASTRTYGIFLFALFIIACGLAFLEKAANPYVTTLGDPATAPRRLNFSQSFNGLSIIFGPVIGGLFIISSKEYTNDVLNAMPFAQAEAIRMEEANSVQVPYLILAGIVLVVAVLFSLIRMPELSSSAESSATMKGILRHRHLVFGIIAQFFYVGAQASIWGYFIDLKLHYAHDDDFEIVRWLYRITENMSATTIAAMHASFAASLFMLGRFVGTWLLNFVRAERLLFIYAIACIMLILTAWLTTGLLAVGALSLTYFFMSIMFPTIFSLSIKELGPQVKLGSSLVIMAIVGGAALPPITGLLSLSGLEHALLVPLISFVVIAYFGWQGYKIKTV